LLVRLIYSLNKEDIIPFSFLSHRNPLIRRTTAQYTYKCCEIMGPGKILSGIKDVTERILITAAQFVVDGPVDIR
jgi:hypothetical protein